MILSGAKIAVVEAVGGYAAGQRTSVAFSTNNHD